MQYTGMTEMFGFVGEMFNAAFKPAARTFEKSVHNRGDHIVHFMTKSNRPLKALGLMTGSFVIVAGSIIINRKLQMDAVIAPAGSSTALLSNEYNTQILPRLKQAIDTAFKYAQNGNISLLDPQLETIAGIVVEYPQFKRFVKYTQAMAFPKSTYFDVEHGGLSVLQKHKQDEDKRSDERENEAILLQSETTDSTASILLSMDEKELQKELLKNMNKDQVEVIKFENQLDYIRHLCVIRRCEKIYYRAIRHAQKGNVQQCADLLSELWEYVCTYEVAPIIIGDDERNVYQLKEDDLYNVMQLCHRKYVQYLIDSAKDVGDNIDQKGLKREKESEMKRTLLNMVWKNLENARLYAEKYRIFNDELKAELRKVWKQKADQFDMEVKETGLV